MLKSNENAQECQLLSNCVFRVYEYLELLCESMHELSRHKQIPDMQDMKKRNVTKHEVCSREGELIISYSYKILFRQTQPLFWNDILVNFPLNHLSWYQGILLFLFSRDHIQEHGQQPEDISWPVASKVLQKQHRTERVQTTLKHTNTDFVYTIKNFQLEKNPKA